MNNILSKQSIKEIRQSLNNQSKDYTFENFKFEENNYIIPLSEYKKAFRQHESLFKRSRKC